MTRARKPSWILICASVRRRAGQPSTPVSICRRSSRWRWQAASSIACRRRPTKARSPPPSRPTSISSGWIARSRWNSAAPICCAPERTLTPDGLAWRRCSVPPASSPQASAARSWSASSSAAIKARSPSRSRPRRSCALTRRRPGADVEEHRFAIVAKIDAQPPAARPQRAAPRTDGDRARSSFISSDFNFESIICLVTSGHKPALPIPVCPASVSISTTSQLKNRKGACESSWKGNALNGVAKMVSLVFTGPFPLV